MKSNNEYIYGENKKKLSEWFKNLSEEEQLNQLKIAIKDLAQNKKKHQKWIEKADTINASRNAITTYWANREKARDNLNESIETMKLYVELY